MAHRHRGELFPARGPRRTALLIVLALHGVVATTMLSTAVLPRRHQNDANLDGLAKFVIRLTYLYFPPSWTLLAVLLVVAVVHLRRTRRRAAIARRYRRVLAAVVLAPFVMQSVPVLALVTAPMNVVLAVVVCVPTTTYALCLAHRMQRFRRVPFSLLFVAAGWGAFVATGFGGTMNTWWSVFSGNYLPLPESLLDPTWVYRMTAPLITGLSEELGKAAGVAVLFVLRRRNFDSVVSGIALGAATGIGFNFTETIGYMSDPLAADAGYQFWARQSLGLMAAHTAFSAVAGAGFGIARQMKNRRQQLGVITLGIFTAASAHACNNTVLGYLARGALRWLTVSETVQVLVVTPVQFLILQGPLIVLYLLLLRRGTRSQAAGLSAALETLPASTHDLITPAERQTLLSPARRFRLKVDAFRAEPSRRCGVAAYRKLARLHTAQLDLATERWHRLRGETLLATPDETVLADRIAQLKFGSEQSVGSQFRAQLEPEWSAR
ncbi:PrsW family intramembrane metalloprotease [Lentzea sp. NPDC051208]|uniref:PrsW family intramembrane metalloprotease n=1 Tax=Lentzea sp. NPDC051208 TaxID=3154642 RepID=UPI0034219A98